MARTVRWAPFPTLDRSEGSTTWQSGISWFCSPACAWASAMATYGGDLVEEFRRPPDSAKPWVYCFWLEGNVTRKASPPTWRRCGESGIGGLLFMDGDMGNPVGPHRFMSESWRAMFKHMVSEADRLGLEINLNNDPGWAGSGGPVGDAGAGDQKVVASETIVQGPIHFEAVLPQAAQDRKLLSATSWCWRVRAAADAKGQLRRIEHVDSTKSFAGGRISPRLCLGPARFPTNPSGRPFPARSASHRPKFRT